MKRIPSPASLHRAQVERIGALVGPRTGGTASAIVVHGPAGAGQADVVRRVLQELGDDARLLEGRCGVGDTSGFGPVRQMADALLASTDPADRATAETLLGSALHETDANLRRLLQQVRGGDTRLNRLETIRRALAEVAGRGRTVVVLHDLHRADEDTLALVDFLLADVVPAGAAIGLRSDGARPRLVFTLDDDDPAGRGLAARLRDSDGIERVAVGPLDPAATVRVLAEPPLADKLHRITGGLPRQVRRLVEALPEDVETLVDARVSTLSDEERRVLVRAQALGEAVTPSALAVVANASRLAVQRLRSNGFLVGGADTVQVSPTWDGARALEPAGEEAMEAHRACASHLEARLAAGGPRALHERITRHLLGCGAIDEAVEHAVLASDWLAQNSALRRAVRLLEDVCEHLDDPAQAARLQVRVVDHEVALGRLDDALERCARLSPGIGVELELRQARIHRMQGDAQAALDALSRLDRDDVPMAVRDVACAQRAEVLLRRGDLQAAQALCDTGLASETTAPLVALELEHTRAKVAFWQGDYALAESRYAQVLERAKTCDDARAARRTRALVLHNMGLVSMRSGRYAEAAASIQEGLGLLSDLGEHFDAAVCGHNLGMAHEYAQRYGMAIRMFEHSIEVLERFGNQVNLCGAVNSLGDLFLALGESWRARKLLEYSLRIAEQTGNDYFVAFNGLRLGALELREGRLEQASQRADEARAAFEQSGHQDELAQARLLSAQCAIARGQTKRASTWIAEVREGTNAEAAARALSLAASLTTGSTPGTAHSQALEAADALERLGQRDGVVEALTVAALAARAGGQSDEADALRARAQTRLDELRSRVPQAHREAFEALPFVTALAQPLPEPTAPRRRTGREVVTDAGHFHKMIGRCAPMQRVFRMVGKLADCDAPILILGESGTGKELVAEAIKAESERADKPFVRVNAAAFADTLLESELFGHEKGAFTGAVSRKLGAFEQADGGTLFLDEIGDISARTQVSLLRVLQEREVRRVGGRQAFKVDVRILCATNRNLEELVAQGVFRLDLYYRIKGLTVELPPLRERGDDILAMADAFLTRMATQHGDTLTLADDARTLLAAYPWPGNVRELENALRSVYFFANEGVITADDLTTYTVLRDAHLTQAPTGSAAPEPSEVIGEGFDLAEAKRALEMRCIRQALEQTGGNITQAARLLGMKRPRLSQKIKEFGMKNR